MTAALEPREDHAVGAIEQVPAALAEPPERDPLRDSLKSDADMAETVAQLALINFAWVPGLGWLRYQPDHGYWRSLPDEAVVEQVREFMLMTCVSLLERAAQETRGGHLRNAQYHEDLAGEWRKKASAARIFAVAKLARGVLRRDAAEFDAHPDLLNVANGVVDLRTGELLLHDRAYRFTRVTMAEYRPGARHGDWQKALRAIPGEVLDWYQIRTGQGVTGHKPPDDLVLVQQGGGENGKSTVTETLGAALGGYHVQLSHRALFGSETSVPTEIMDLMGCRLATLEETPEERRLSMIALKNVTSDTIRARRLHRDSVEFRATHSLRINTNYRLMVKETDHGTWRRLALVRFPYRFVKPGEARRSELDMDGDPGLKQRCIAGADGQHEAALAWAVEGAVRWYAGDEARGIAPMAFPPMPQQVRNDTEAWRAESDQVLCYIRERLEFAPEAHVTADDITRDMTEWLKERGSQPWNHMTIADRLGGHQEFEAHQVRKKKTRRKPGLSRPDGVSLRPVGDSYQAWFGVRFRPVPGCVPTVPGFQELPNVAPRIEQVPEAWNSWNTAGQTDNGRSSEHDFNRLYQVAQRASGWSVS